MIIIEATLHYTPFWMKIKVIQQFKHKSNKKYLFLKLMFNKVHQSNEKLFKKLSESDSIVNKLPKSLWAWDFSSSK